MAPIISFVGKSGVGKTTLLERVVRTVKARGYRVAVIKHHAHTTSLDIPGKDSWRLAEAGADVVIVSSPTQVAHFERTEGEKTLAEIAATVQNVDLILTEGFGREATRKIELVRAELGADLTARPDELMAVVSNCPLEVNVPQFDFNSVEEIVDFLAKEMNLSQGLRGSV